MAATTTMQRVSDIEQKETTLLPQHRHGVLRLLMEHLRNGHRHAADSGGAAAAPRLPSVAACAEYVRALERQVYVQAQAARRPYMRAARSMAFNLRQNGAYLVETYTPQQLPQLDHTLLAKNTPMETWYENHLENQRKQEEMLQMKPTDLLEDDGTSLMQCSRCQSSDIIWEQKQTRGADESMTVFFQCKNCGKRWKMS